MVQVLGELALQALHPLQKAPARSEIDLQQLEGRELADDFVHVGVKGVPVPSRNVQGEVRGSAPPPERLGVAADQDVGEGQSSADGRFLERAVDRGRNVVGMA